MKQIKAWLIASRPKTLIASISPVLIGSTLALDRGLFDGWIFFFTLITALGIQIATNFCNDYWDFLKGADTSERKGPVRVTQAAILSLSAVKKATSFMFLITALAGSFLVWKGGVFVAVLLVISLLLSYLYTAGPFPLAYVGLGEIFVLIFFGPIAVGGTFFLQTTELSLSAFLAGISPGALSAAILMVNNLRDVDEDRKASKKTLVVRGGALLGKSLYVLFILAAFFSPLLLISDHPWLVLLMPLFLFAIPTLYKVCRNKNNADFNAFLPKTAQLLLIYTLCFCFLYVL